MNFLSLARRVGSSFTGDHSEGEKFDPPIGSAPPNPQLNVAFGQRLARGSVARLPPEVLDLIFHHAVHDPDAHLRYLTHIGLTCRQWRGAVLLSPRLWSYLPPICERPSSTAASADIRRLLSTVRLFLGRSGDHPLTFQLHALLRPFSVGEEPLAEVIALLVPHCRRWEKVSLSVGRHLLEAASQIYGNLPILHSLDLAVLTPDDGSGSQIINHFINCPSLRHVSLSITWSLEKDKVLVNIPWSQIKVFKDFKSVPAGLRCFQYAGDEADGLQCWMSSPNLSFIQQEFSRVSTSTISKLSLTTTPNTPILEWFASKLVLPKLAYLELYFQSIDITRLPLTDFLSFIRRSKCLLKLLRIDRALCEPGVLAEILRLCGDNMEEMTVPIIPIEDLKQLTLDRFGNLPVLVPKLRALEVLVNHMSYGDISVLDGSVLTEMALSRDFDSDLRQRDGVAALAVKVRAPGRAVPTLRLMFHRLEDSSHSPERVPMIRTGREEAERIVAGWEEVLRGLCFSHEESGWRRYKPTPRHDLGESIDRVLAEMENYPVEKLDVVLLRKYSIPKILHHGRCTTLSPKCKPCEKRYHVSSRLEGLREKWRPTIVFEIASYHRWIFLGRCEWVYLPAQSRRRRGNEPWSIATECEGHGEAASNDRYHELLWEVMFSHH